MLWLRSLAALPVLFFFLSFPITHVEAAENTSNPTSQTSPSAARQPGFLARLFGPRAKPTPAPPTDPPDVVEVKSAIEDIRHLSDSVDYADPKAIESARDRLAPFLKNPQRLQAVARYLEAHRDERLLDHVFTILRRISEAGRHSALNSEKVLRQQELLRTVGYDQLSNALLAGTESGERPFIEQLESYQNNLREQLNRGEARNTVRRNRLLRRARKVESALFVLHSGVVALGLSAFGFFGGHLIGLPQAPARATGELAAAWGIGSLYGFKFGYWPFVRNPVTKFLLRGSYRAVVRSFQDLIRTDPDEALSEIVVRFAKAKPSATDASLLREAAFDALIAYNRPEVTRALLDIGVADLRSENYRRAMRAFTEIGLRDSGDLGDFARQVTDALGKRNQYNRSRFGQRALYGARNLALWGIPSVAGAIGLYALFPQVIPFYTALFGGLGVAGTRVVLGELSLFRFPEDRIRKKLNPLREKYRASLMEAVRKARGIDEQAKRELLGLLDSLDKNDRDRSKTVHEEYLASRDCCVELGQLTSKAPPTH